MDIKLKLSLTYSVDKRKYIQSNSFEMNALSSYFFHASTSTDDK